MCVFVFVCVCVCATALKQAGRVAIEKSGRALAAEERLIAQCWSKSQRKNEQGEEKPQRSSPTTLGTVS